MQQNKTTNCDSEKGTKFASVRRGGESTYIQVRQIGSKGVLTNRAGIIVLLVVIAIGFNLCDHCCRWPLYALIMFITIGEREWYYCFFIANST